MTINPLSAVERLAATIADALAQADALQNDTVGCHLSAAQEALLSTGLEWTPAAIEAAFLAAAPDLASGPQRQPDQQGG